MALDEITRASIESFNSIAFNSACLYAATVFIFGLLALNNMNSPRQQRQQQWRQFYGNSDTANVLLAKQKSGITTSPGQQDDKNGFFAGLDFLYYFFFRPSVIVSIIFATIVIRNWNNSLMSEILSFGFSACVASQWSTYHTKFIPFMCIAIGLSYGSLHLMAAENNWFGFGL